MSDPQLSLKIVQQVNSPIDLDKLNEITAGILGEVCWKARLGYTDELELEIGARIPYTHPLMLRMEHGSWMFGSHGTPWELEYLYARVVTSDAPKEIVESKLANLVDTQIVAFDTIFPDLALRIEFSNGYRLSILPGPDDDKWDVAYWELFIPHNRILEVGPGSKWKYSRSDVVEE